MKRAIVSGLGLVGVLLVASAGSAAPPSGNPGPAAPGNVPPSRSAPPLQAALQITSVGRAPDANDAFQFDVALENASSSTKHPTISLHGPGLAGTPQTIDLGGKTTKHFLFADKVGPGPCDRTTSYEIHYGEAGGAESVKKFTVKATNCSFSSKVNVPWDAKPAAQLAALQQGATYISKVAIQPGSGTCMAPVAMKATIVNNGAKAANVSLHATPTYESSGLLTVPEHGSTVTVLSSPSQITRHHYLMLKDSTSPPSAHIVDSAISVDTTISCTYTFDVEGLAAPAPLPLPILR